MNEQVDIQIPSIQQKLDMLISSGAEKREAKASLFNLIIYAREAERVAYFEELIRNILSKFPCRIIFIYAHENSKEYFHVDVTSAMSGVGKEQAICDRITIKSSEGQLPRIPSILFPSLIPDLPIYLLWGQSPFEEHLIFPALQPYASRVIVDPECFDDLSIFCRQMEANLNLLKMDLMDMHWALLSSWRDLLATLFDRPEKLMLLKKWKSAIITYNSSRSKMIQYPEMRAIYLQGWLASRLGASYRQAEFFEDNLLISYYGQSNPLVIALQPKMDPQQPPGTIFNVELVFTTGDSYTITPMPGLAQALIHESSTLTCALPFTLPLPNVFSGVGFLNEILYQNVGEHYRDMLKMISHLNFKRQNDSTAQR